MADISFEKPIAISMDVTETDDYLPSIKMFLKCHIIHPTGFLTYQADDIWFTCSKWDEFLKKLLIMKNDEKVEASLVDMNEYFEIGISKSQDETFFTLRCQEPNIGEGSITMNFNSQIDIDVLAIIRREFDKFPKWW